MSDFGIEFCFEKVVVGICFTKWVVFKQSLCGWSFEGVSKKKKIQPLSMNMYPEEQLTL